MGEVFREITLPWKGQDYTMTPSVGLLRRIKQQGINNLVLAGEVYHGGADPADLAVVHSLFMRAAGVQITEEDSYGFLTGDETEEVVAFQQAYVGAVIPSIDLGKKPEAPVVETKPKPKRKRKAAT